MHFGNICLQGRNFAFYTKHILKQLCFRGLFPGPGFHPAPPPAPRGRPVASEAVLQAAGREAAGPCPRPRRPQCADRVGQGQRVVCGPLPPASASAARPDHRPGPPPEGGLHAVRPHRRPRLRPERHMCQRHRCMGWLYSELILKNLYISVYTTRINAI